jgi:DNA-binding response OmpR family regulator
MSKNGIKILIIDYEPRGIKQLNDPLEQAGFETLVAKDGVTGIDRFKSTKPDLVLIEAMLPKRHGFEVCQELKQTEHGRDTPIVIVTSVYKGRKYRTQAIHQYGCDEYLEKPVDPDHLRETVERLLSRVKAVPVAEAATTAQPEQPVPPAQPAPPVPSTPTDATEADIIDHLNSILGDTKETGGSGSAG